MRSKNVFRALQGYPLRDREDEGRAIPQQCDKQNENEEKVKKQLYWFSDFDVPPHWKYISIRKRLSIDFDKYLTEHHGKVLYCAIEEGYGYTLKEKLEHLDAIHDNLFISRNIPENLSDYQFVFIDSVSKGKITNDKLNELIKSHPGTAFIFIFHSTKNGDFRGGQVNAHDVDCIIVVEEGRAKGMGRFGNGRCEIFS